MFSGRVSYGKRRQTPGDAGEHFLQEDEHPAGVLAYFPQQTHPTGPPAPHDTSQRAG